MLVYIFEIVHRVYAADIECMKGFSGDIQLSWNEYPVIGDNYISISNNAQFVSKNGSLVRASTDYSIKKHNKPDSNEKYYFYVTASIEVTLPSKYINSNDDLVIKWWRKVHELLCNHELGHVEIILAYLRKMNDVGLNSDYSVNQSYIFANLSADLQKANDLYDSYTTSSNFTLYKLLNNYDPYDVLFDW